MTINPTPNLDWRALVAQKRKQLDAQIPSEWRLSDSFVASLPENGHLIEADIPRRSGILTGLELDITENHTAAQLLQKLAWGDVSSVAVTTAFCKRAAIAQQLTSCLTDHFFSRALERAKYLDDYLKREKKVVGPLHGLPISLKDSFCLEGIQSTIGYASFLAHPPASSNSALVNMLLDLGAVLYVKTNIPQTMMTGDSDNNIYGRTLNPHNTNLTAGGSSGGEGALVAFRGSILGVGTDIAGSIRIPALCCGVYGFKPSTDRIPFGGQVTGAIVSAPGIKPSAGPLAHSLDDIELFMSTVLAAEPWKYDITATSAAWTSAPPSRPAATLLTIGILPEDPQFPLHPPIRRALDSAIAALTIQGHQIIHLDADADTNSDRNPSKETAYANRLGFQYFIYGPHVDHMAASGEPAVPSVQRGPNPMFTGSFPVDQELGVFEKIEALHTARREYCDAWRKLWVRHGLDVVLGPGAQSTAVPHDTYGWPPYTLLWNLLDVSTSYLVWFLRCADNPSSTHGAPCALQIIAPRFHDEKCLSAARIIDRDIRHAKSPTAVSV
ncbi:general amidase GmdB [Aspergillus affinis]|uniref:general amidase GmdB n=1 Tax=Aspergillus affinis TaxID=1070780 RepID=UPI0022FE842A|nr:uncharacterized protein KD926_008104 [Aspergillus affinis]KAI9040537.1 hypothetical protein KD926_008104 [Aspergillus affinis]